MDYNQMLAEMLQNPPDRAAAQEAALRAQQMQQKMGGRQWGGLFGLAEGAIKNRPSKREEYSNALMEALEKQQGLDQYDTSLETVQDLFKHGQKAAIDAEHRDPSDLERRLEYFRANPEEYQKFMQAGHKPGQTFNFGDGPKVGTIPPGFQLAKDPSGAYRMEPIPGGPAAADQQKEDIAQETKRAFTKYKAGHMLDVIQKARGIVGPLTTGVPGKVAESYPGSKRKDFEGYIRTLQSNQMLEALEALKSQSATGASGLGQLSNKEGERLVSMIAALDPDQSPGKIKEDLQLIERHYNRMLELAEGKLPDAYNPEALKKQAQEAIDSGADPEAVRAELEQLLKAVESGR